MPRIDPTTQAPSAVITQRVQKNALAQGLIFLSYGQYGNVICFLHRLTIPDAQFDQALNVLADANLTT